MSEKPKVTTVPGSVIFPSIKTVTIEPRTILAEVTFVEALSLAQINALRGMYASYKKKSRTEFMLAMEISGKSVRFRTFGNKTPPPEKNIRGMLQALGMAEANYVPPAPPKKSLVKPAVKKQSWLERGSSTRTAT